MSAVAVVIGRFQTVHNGHLALLQAALAAAPRVIVLLGSAHQARSPRHPFSWTERAEMLRLVLTDAERERVEIVPLRDLYDEARWVQAVRDAVQQRAGHSDVTLVGHFKDATSDYLRRFSPWRLLSLPRQHRVDATHLRAALFEAAPDDLDGVLASWVDQVPPGTRSFVQAWARLPYLIALRREWAMLKAYRQAWAAAPYAPVFVTVDLVLQCAGSVLLIQRAKDPGQGLWALPGGFVEPRDTLYQSAVRELEEETGLRLLPDVLAGAFRGVAVFDHPDRSQRGRTITHAHHFDLGDRELPEVQGADDAAQARWVPVSGLLAMEGELYDDHFHMLDRFLGLRAHP
ncbi:bifunctional nicotinamide-nucleotide adenylyltransferase/Nudix hydroxylase [Roseateles sp. LKC17W]|uniref:Bifunctional nicotinamide-nucleotide adenylyltransferase/Nudix hydroxylase n=1 Tax=Pelomonas margarita TaxID=3299031 RepID=A0ABW7FIF6_9BURK